MLYNLTFYDDHANYVGQHRKINSAQLGGHIAHIVEDYGAFVVTDQDDKVLMRYNKKGIR